VKKSIKKTRRPSIGRAKAQAKPCCGALRGHRADCTGEAPGVLPGEAEVLAGTGADVEERDQASEVQPGPYLAALQSIASSLEALAELVLTGGLPTLALAAPAAPPAAPEAPRKPRKAKEAAPPAADGNGALPGLQEAQAPAEAPRDPVRLCCGARVAAGIHMSNCPTLNLSVPPPTPAAPPAAPPAAVSVEEVRSSFLSYASRKGRDEAVALLQRFGVAKVGDLPAAQWPALLGAMKAG
jgi:hypothetical protein